MTYKGLFLLAVGIVFLGVGIALGVDSAVKGMGAATFWAMITGVAGAVMIVNELSKRTR
jgi:hypothetical protein